MSADCFDPNDGMQLTPVSEVLKRLKLRTSTTIGSESLPLDYQMMGRVLAQPIIAQRAHPPHANAAVDGFGFAASTTDQPQFYRLVDGRAAAGSPFKGSIPSGFAVRVLTGATIPKGVDTVVRDEDARKTRRGIEIEKAESRGANVRKAGEDIAAGELAVAAGRRLTAADLALAAAVGEFRVDVRQSLRVAILSTGNELIQTGSVARPDQIYDANRPLLLSLITAFGFDPIDLGCIPDDRAALREALDSASKQAHVILTSGGASSGDEDHVGAILESTNRVHDWRIAIKPGRPLVLGEWCGVPVFGLPGNPVAVMVCTLIFALPAMKVLSGQTWSEPQGFDIPAAFEKRKRGGRREYLRARIRSGKVEAFQSEGSGRISGLSWAEGLVELSDVAQNIRVGDRVRYIPFSSFGLTS
ncbi:MAG: molybdopterin-binding protein [Aestuariivita sp.]|nr:molybdopterin-binding protein [Aestuariivita sp.]MCY4203659.1 molybdopterin-binding protein [Aestuariivita sp.]